MDQAPTLSMILPSRNHGLPWPLVARAWPTPRPAAMSTCRRRRLDHARLLQARSQRSTPLRRPYNRPADAGDIHRASRVRAA